MLTTEANLPCFLKLRKRKTMMENPRRKRQDRNMRVKRRYEEIKRILLTYLDSMLSKHSDIP